MKFLFDCVGKHQSKLTKYENTFKIWWWSLEIRSVGGYFFYLFLSNVNFYIPEVSSTCIITLNVLQYCVFYLDERVQSMITYDVLVCLNKIIIGIDFICLITISL